MGQTSRGNTGGQHGAASKPVVDGVYGSLTLNGYPGPLHVLELAEELELSDEQRVETQEIFNQMQASARGLGAELVDAERTLDELFRDKSIDETSLSELTTTIGRLDAQLRSVHLHAHLRQAELLSTKQIARYMVLRGYAHGEHQHHHVQTR